MVGFKGGGWGWAEGRMGLWEDEVKGGGLWLGLREEDGGSGRGREKGVAKTLAAAADVPAPTN